MTEPTGDREQDVGRKHRRASVGRSVETEALLERYRAAMRAELEDLLVEIRPAGGQLTIDGAVERPNLERRKSLWDLATKLGKELAGAPDSVAPSDLEPRAGAHTRGRKPAAPRLTVAQRRALGAGE